jgi:dihydropyrimidinase
MVPKEHSMAECDIVIRCGEIVTAAGSVGCADIGVTDGTVVQIGGALTGRRELDAAGKLVLPGGVDAHVHLLSQDEASTAPGWVDDFGSGSAAALAGGITTLGNMTFPLPDEPPLAALEREAAVARRQTIADLFLHPVLTSATPPVLDEIPMLLDTGCNSIKVFTVFPWFDAR